MSLKTYAEKRNFSRTKEPKAEAANRVENGFQFVIQKHAASRLHFDFRLEFDGVLKSWAVPKGPSLNPKNKRLAVHVEDHPLSYGEFEGNIPKGEYGGGAVMLWDHGTWEPLDKNPVSAYKKGALKFRLHGQRLVGAWALIRMKSDKAGDADNWLLIKEKDEHADDSAEPVESELTSLVSNRTMEQIAENASPVAEMPELPNAPKRRMPEHVKPQLCTLVDAPPTGDDWLHEIKLDGYRLLAYASDGKCTLATRNGLDSTAKYPAVAAACAAFQRALVLDGEVVVLRPDGSSNFQALQNLLRSGKKPPVIYFVFDILHCDGQELTSVPLLKRKEFLQSLLAKLPADSPVRYCDHVLGNGDAFLQQCSEHGLEGIISKRIDSSYLQKRTRNWLKVKCTKGQEFVIGGYTLPSGSREAFGALLLGYFDSSKKLHYAGRVGTGFTGQSLKDIGAKLKKIAMAECPFVNPPTGREARSASWVKPEMVCEVSFTEWTEEGRLRHPSFKGLRADKSANEVRRELTRAAVSESEKPDAPTGRSKPTAKRAAATVAGVALSNPGKLLYPEGITKLQLAEYYEAVADPMLKHLAGRPLMLLRCPGGRGIKCFYQKHLGETVPAHVHGVEIEEKGGPETYIVIDDVKGLIGLANLGVLEFHTWGCHKDAIEKPDVMVFDLDPDPGVSHAALLQAVAQVKELLDELKLKSFLKTTGGKGYHVEVPLSRRHDWETHKQFAGAVADALVRAEPKRYTATMSKAKRAGKVFVDYFRNGRGATFIAPFSTRNRPGAPVAMPLHWEELPERQPAQWNIGNVHERLSVDPWKDYGTVRQSLTVAMRKQLGLA